MRLRIIHKKKTKKKKRKKEKKKMSIFYCFYNLDYHLPGSRNCAAQQRELQIILDLADKSSKRNIIV